MKREACKQKHVVAIQYNIYPKGGRDGKKGSKGDERKVRERGGVVEIERERENGGTIEGDKATKAEEKVKVLSWGCSLTTKGRALASLNKHSCILGDNADNSTYCYFHNYIIFIEFKFRLVQYIVINYHKYL